MSTTEGGLGHYDICGSRFMPLQLDAATGGFGWGTGRGFGRGHRNGNIVHGGLPLLGGDHGGSVTASVAVLVG